MKLVGAEERALWAALVTAATKKVPSSVVGVDKTAELVATYADAVVLEYRKRDGSHP